MPGMLSDDDEDVEEEDDPAGGLLAGTKTRVRRQYDERRDRDDAEGIEDVSHLESRNLGISDTHLPFCAGNSTRGSQ